MTPDETTAWLREYASAWERSDVVLDLYTPDATYQSHPFRPTHRGHAGIRAYADAAVATQAETRVILGEMVASGDRAVAEWWTTMTEDDGPVTLPGVLILDFEEGRCRALRECWALEAGIHEPFEGWGRFDGADAAGPARAWVEAYERAWRAGDADAAAELYSEDVVFRSHPFREAAHGRDEVRSYTAKAFASERERVVRMGEPLAAGAGAAVEYWTTYVEDGAPQTLAGCVLMSFDEEGLVTRSRDYWHVADGTFDPPRGWGWR